MGQALQTSIAFPGQPYAKAGVVTLPPLYKFGENVIPDATASISGEGEDAYGIVTDIVIRAEEVDTVVTMPNPSEILENNPWMVLNSAYATEAEYDEFRLSFAVTGGHSVTFHSSPDNYFYVEHDNEPVPTGGIVVFKMYIFKSLGQPKLQVDEVYRILPASA